jgi:Family of unknown function (DUF5988)
VGDVVNVVLKGGPAELPAVLSIERSKLEDGKIKIESHGGYEHFECSDQKLLVFRWTNRTKIAE